MMEPAPPITVDLRIPGTWSHPRELLERLPAGYQLTPEALSLPSGTIVEFGAVPAESQFPGIFRTSLRRPATAEELATADNYTVNVLLSGPGGSVEAAKTMLEAGRRFRTEGRECSTTTAGWPFGGEMWLQLPKTRPPTR